MVRRQLAAAIAVVSLALAACGSSATPPPSVAAGTPAPSAEASSTPPATAAPPTAAPSPTPPPVYQATEDLEVGDCYDPVEDADDQSLLAAIVIPCDQAHLSEVFGLADLEGDETAPFPGADAVDDDSIALCDAAFEAYVGIPLEDSRLSYVYYTPTESSWTNGDREVMCSVEDPGNRLEGSVAGTAQ